MFLIQDVDQDLQLLNNLNNPESLTFEIIRTSELITGKKYRIYDFFVMTTKYGNKVIATLGNNKKYFMPPSYAVTIKKWAKCPEDINCNHLFMVFEGKKANKFQTPMLKFIRDETISDEDDDVGTDEVDTNN